MSYKIYEKFFYFTSFMRIYVVVKYVYIHDHNGDRYQRKGKIMKKSLKFLLLLGLVIPGLAGCSGDGGKDASGPDGGSTTQPSTTDTGTVTTTTGQTSTPTSEPTSSGTSLPDDGVVPYEGDDTKEVEKFDNVPVTSYSAETKKKLLEAADIMAGDNNVPSKYEAEMEKYFLAAKIGDTVAQEIAKLIIDGYGLGRHFVKFDSTADAVQPENISKFAYRGLKIINSVSPEGLVELLKFINKETKENVGEEKTIYEYVGARYNGLQYETFKQLKENGIADEDLQTHLKAWENSLEKYAISEEQKGHYKDYQQSYADTKKDGVLPSEYIEFFTKNAEKMQKIMVKDLKAFIDAYDSIVVKILPAIRNTQNYSISYFNAAQNVYSSGGADGSGIIKAVLNSKEKLLGVLKTFLEDDESNSLMLESLTKWVIPGFVNRGSQYSEDLTVIQGKLEALEGSQLSSVANFLLRLLNEVNFDDLAEMLAYVISGAYQQYNFAFFRSKYVSSIKKVIAATPAGQKADLQEVFAVIGLDIIDELTKFVRIVEEKGSKTETEFVNEVIEWGKAILETVKENLPFLAMLSQGGRSSGGYSSYTELDEGLNVGIFYQGDVNLGDSIALSQLRVEGQYNHSWFDFSYGEYLNYIEGSEEDIPPYYLEAVLALKDGKFAINSIQLDTSKLGRAECVIKITFASKQHEISTYMDVSDPKIAHFTADNINDRVGTCKDNGLAVVTSDSAKAISIKVESSYTELENSLRYKVYLEVPTSTFAEAKAKPIARPLSYGAIQNIEESYHTAYAYVLYEVGDYVVMINRYFNLECTTADVGKIKVYQDPETGVKYEYKVVSESLADYSSVYFNFVGIKLFGEGAVTKAESLEIPYEVTRHYSFVDSNGVLHTGSYTPPYGGKTPKMTVKNFENKNGVITFTTSGGVELRFFARNLDN